MHFLEIGRLSEVLTLESKLFHSITVEGRKEILKQSCLTLNKRIIFLRLAKCASLAVGINS